MAETEEINLRISLEGSDGKKTVAELKKELIEAEKAAKGVGEKIGDGAKDAEVKTVSLKAQLRAMMQELATLPEGSKRFNEVAAAAGKLKDQIGDISARVNNLGSDTKKLDSLAGAGTAIAGGFQAASGTMALFGSDSKKVEEAIKNIIAVQGILNGVQLVANQLQAESALRIGISKTASKIATASQWLWNDALSANPIGLIIIGVAALTAGIIAFAKPIKDFISNWDNLRLVMLALLGPIGWVMIAYEKLFGEEAMLAAEREKAAAKRRDQEKENAKMLQDRLDQIKELQKAEQESFEKSQTSFDLNIARAEAEGKSSRQLKIDKIQDIIDHTKAVLANNELLIQAYVDYYKRQVAIRGQSEQEFINSMKAQGVDLLALQNKANEQLQKYRDDVFSAETDLLVLKKQFRNEDIKDAQLASDERKKILEKETEEAKKLADFLFQVDTNRRAAEFKFQQDLQAEKDAMFEAETIRMEQEIDRENEHKQRQIDITQELANARDEANQRNIDTANNLLKIAEDASVLFQGKEFARIKAKQQAGENLTNSEIARLKRAEKVQKAFAVAQVALDSARAISSAVASAAALPFPANIPAIISAVAAVVSALSQTKQLLGGGSSVSASDVGSSSSSSVNQQIENTGSQEANVIKSGSTLLNQEPQKVYVIEADITSKQNKVKVIEAAATFGG
ncbi:MAG: hypothetical protein ACRCYO_13350 [Bacteroidia bacterium]